MMNSVDLTLGLINLWEKLFLQQKGKEMAVMPVTAVDFGKKLRGKIISISKQNVHFSCQM